jgi:hypothetical protein
MKKFRNSGILVFRCHKFIEWGMTILKKKRRKIKKFKKNVCSFPLLVRMKNEREIKYLKFANVVLKLNTFDILVFMISS